VTTFRTRALAFLPLLFLVTQFWKPALFDGKSLIHGDSITDGLSLLALQAKSLHHLGQLLWADGVYGGHPIFAEGQGAFASPVNIVLAWLVAPLSSAIFAMNLGHWLMVLLAGIGVMGLCRSLGASHTASAFAALAVVFSPIWVGASQNFTIYGALAWVPWSFWALEEWLRRPGIRSAVLLGSAVAMTILSGYPQAFHGAVLYMAATLIAAPFQAETRRILRVEWRLRVGTGLIAILACAGLSAIQWLPLLELTGLSHRSDGIGLYVQVPHVGYFRGLLFTWPRLPGSGDYFPGPGSLMVTLLASLVLVVRTPTRVKGHVLAAYVLMQLGMEEASPLFRLVYHHQLIPGLRYFRTVHLYINIAVIGFAVLAAFAIDGLRRLPAIGALRNASRVDIARLVGGLLIVGFWSLATLLAWVPDLKWVNFGVPLAALVGGAALVLVGRGRFVPLLMLALLFAECMNLRLHLFHFYDPSVLAEPASSSAILAAAGQEDGKLFDISEAGIYGFTDSRNPAVVDQARRMMEANSAMTNTLWGLRSLNGALALPMRRQRAADSRIRDELNGKVSTPAGARLMDLLAVRFISVAQPANISGANLFWSDPPRSIYFMENGAARQRFQLYAHYVTAGSADEALATIAALRAPTLVIENPPDRPQSEQADDPTVDGDPPGRFTVLKAKSTEYRVDIAADRPAWFFVADANYPGWRATLDGKPAPLFSAQLLGKAVAIPQGRHRLEIAFLSSTFIVGLSISAVSLVATLLALWTGRRSALHSP